jgi:hypothetical protein
MVSFPNPGGDHGIDRMQLDRMQLDGPGGHLGDHAGAEDRLGSAVGCP